MAFLRRLFFRLTGHRSFAPVDPERLRFQRVLVSALHVPPRARRRTDPQRPAFPPRRPPQA